MHRHHSLTVETEVDAADRTYDWLSLLCKRYGTTPDHEFQICLGTVEAINNLLLHTPPELGANVFHVHCTFSENGVQIKISHRAPPYTVPPHFETKATDDDKDLLKESGRGWMVLREWFSAVHYEFDTGINRLTLTKQPSPCLLDHALPRHS